MIEATLQAVGEPISGKTQVSVTNSQGEKSGGEGGIRTPGRD
jgi:hypothetical protein